MEYIICHLSLNTPFLDGIPYFRSHIININKSAYAPPFQKKFTAHTSNTLIPGFHGPG